MSLKLIPYVVMDGNTKEAIEFYKKALNAEVVYSQSFGDMPGNPDFPIPDEAKERIAHATIKIGKTELMFSDTFPGQPHTVGNQVNICISTDDTKMAEEMYEALKQNGQVNMPLQETFFSPAYGSVTDKFGITFQVAVEGNR